MTDVPADRRAKRDKPEKKLGLVGEFVEIIKTVVYALLIALVLRVILFQPYTIPSASDEPNLFRGDYIIVTKWSYGWSKNSFPLSPPLFQGRILFSPPKRGDIVVFKLPSSGHVDYIKRLIGLPGDRIQVRSGQLYINDKPVSEKPVGTAIGDLPSGQGPVKLLQETNPEGRNYRIQLPASGVENEGDTGVYVVPQHCYFMMGDNRENSMDSRFDSGLPPDDARLGGCGWDSSLDAKLGGDGQGVGFVPEVDLVGRAAIILLSWNTGIDENHPCCANIFKPWTWFIDARPSRFFKVLH